jgi:hypothetical protein
MSKNVKIILFSLFILMAVFLFVFLNKEIKAPGGELENKFRQGGGGNEQKDNDPYETIANEYYGGISGKNTYVVSNEDDWRGLWSMAYANQVPEPELPAVDFEKEMVIAVFAGEFPSGGYEVKIDRLDEYDDVIIITFVITSPGAACGNTEALTQPFHIAKIKKTDKEISFVERNEVNDCE